MKRFFNSQFIPSSSIIHLNLNLRLNWSWNKIMTCEICRHCAVRAVGFSTEHPVPNWMQAFLKVRNSPSRTTWMTTRSLHWKWKREWLLPASTAASKRRSRSAGKKSYRNVKPIRYDHCAKVAKVTKMPTHTDASLLTFLGTPGQDYFTSVRDSKAHQQVTKTSKRLPWSTW